MPTFSFLPAFHSISNFHRAILLFLIFALVATLCAPVSFAALNPVPYIDIVTPFSVTPGSTGLVLTVRGTGFVSGFSTVRWNGTALVTTFVSAQQLTAAVPDGLVAAVGLGSITVLTG
jgi:hypothetical protein